MTAAPKSEQEAADQRVMSALQAIESGKWVGSTELARRIGITQQQCRYSLQRLRWAGVMLEERDRHYKNAHRRAKVQKLYRLRPQVDVVALSKWLMPRSVVVTITGEAVFAEYSSG